MDKNTKILVTGGGGFLGTHVVDLLRSKGFNNLFIPRQKDYNLTKESDVIKMYEDSKPQILIHLASHVSGLGDNFKYQADFFYKNIMIGTLVLHHAWKNNVKNVVATSAGCGYPEFAPVPLNEDDYWNGFPQKESAPYSLAKRMLHIQSLAYWKQHNFPIKIVLPGNIYGPHDNFDLEAAHVIPALVRKFVEAKMNNTDVNVWGDGKATRDFIHAHDVAVGIFDALKLSQPELINLSSGEEVSIKQVVDDLIKISGFSKKIVWDPSRVSGQSRRFFDIKKSQNLLNFKQSFSLYDGLKDTYDWYLENKDFARNSFERNLEVKNEN
mgnify:FL=1|tara:strand:+ start:14335 stop:15309 length:975 start_codon:yes stop_codon:yes gene_type:complete